jgi:hypothetical protein
MELLQHPFADVDCSQVYPGEAAYSSLVDLGAGQVGLLFEADGYGRIVFSAATIY